MILSLLLATRSSGVLLFSGAVLWAKPIVVGSEKEAFLNIQRHLAALRAHNVLEKLACLVRVQPAPDFHLGGHTTLSRGPTSSVISYICVIMNF